MLKRLIGLFALVGMISGLVSSPARAEVIVNKACSGGGTFEVEGNVVTGRQDNCIGSVVIPEGVTLIDEYAFGESTGITSITIPASVTEIYGGSFGDSDITAINVSTGNANFKSIDGVLFNKSGTTLLMYPSAKSGAYTTPPSTTTIGEYAFEYTSAVTSITLSANVSNISESAFSQSTLTAINVVAGNNTFKSIDGVLFTKNGATLILYPSTKAGAYTIPVEVTAIGGFAFQDATLLTAVIVPVNVTTIGERAFFNAATLATVSFDVSSKLTSIGEDAFRDTALTTVDIPASVTTIGATAFYSRTIATVTFQANSKLTSIGDDAFSQTELTQITIPASVTTIGDSAFGYTRTLASVEFQSGSKITSIGNRAFIQTALTEIDVPASVTSIGDEAFDSLPLTSVTFEAGSKLISIGYAAFRGTVLSEVIIPASVTSIGDQAFRQTSLTSVTFEAGSKLTSIGDQAFQQSDKLESIAIPASVTKIGDYAFTNSVLLDNLSFEAGSQLVTIGKGAFVGLVKLAAVSIPASVTTIEGFAFEGASSLVTVIFEPGSKLTTIENHAFRSTSLTEITIPAGVTSFGPWAFSFARSLSSINFLGNSPTVGDGTFYEVPNSATAYVSNCATGFSADSNGKWNGLALSVVPSSNPCIAVYDLGGGSGVSTGSLGVDGKIAAAPTPPTRAGYTFSGWSATKGGDLVTFPYGASGSANLTLFAKWLGNTNTVTYNSGNGSAVPSGTFITGGRIAEAPTPPTREGFTFDIWRNENGNVVNFPYTPNAVADITLFAQWERNETTTPPATPVVTPTTKPNTKPAVKPTPTLKPKTSYIPKFSAGASSLTKSGKTALKKIVKTSGADATYTITGAASKSPGIPTRFVKALAMARAEKVKAQLIKLGVKKSKIKIVVKITGSKVTPITSIVSKSLTK